MNIEFDDFEIFDLLLVTRREFHNCERYFKQFPDVIQGLKTPKEAEAVYNKFLVAIKQSELYNQITQI